MNARANEKQKKQVLGKNQFFAKKKQKREEKLIKKKAKFFTRRKKGENDASRYKKSNHVSG
tara:strand:- start:146 stop:328 length:183 start_codon:yes stop_codon:yes gene_type:complete